MRAFYHRTLTVDVDMLEHLVLPVEDDRAPEFTLLVDRTYDDDAPLEEATVIYNMQSGEVIVQHPDYDRPFLTLNVSQMPQFALRYFVILLITETAFHDAIHAELGEDTGFENYELIKGDRVQLEWDADLHLTPVFAGYTERLSWYDHEAQVLVDVKLDATL